MIKGMVKKNKSIKYSWIMTYGILFLLPLLISAILFYIIDGNVKDEVNRSNYFVLKQFQQYVDSLVKDVDSMAVDLAFNDKVQQIAGFSGEPDLQERVKILNLNTEMRNKIYNDAIEEVYIYFKKIDTVISRKNVMEAKDYFNMFSENNKLQANEWIELNNTEYRGSYINIKSKTGRSSDGILAYVLSVPNNTNYDGCTKVVIVIDKSKFLNMTQDVQAIGKRKVAVLDSNNGLLLQSGNLDSLSKLTYKDLIPSTLVQYKGLKGDNLIVSHIDSKIQKWKYLFIMPESDYWGSLQQYRKLIFFGVLFCLITGVISAVLLFRRNYEPLKQLVALLRNGKTEDIAGSRNEYNIIEGIIKKSLDEKNEIARWISFQKESLQNNFIEDIIKGRTDDKIMKDCKTLDINFAGEQFFIISFSFLSNDESGNNVETLKLIQFVIQNMLLELVQDTGKVFALDIDNNIICLINVTGLENMNGKYETYVKELLGTIQDFIKENYKMNFFIGVSNLHQELTNVKKAYKEILELAEFNEYDGKEGILFYEDIKTLSNSLFYYPVKSQQALINAIKLGDYRKVSKIIDDIYDNNFNEKVLNNSQLQCLRFNIIGTVVKIINELNSYNGKFRIDVKAIERLGEVKSFNKFKEELLNILSNICESITEEKKPDTALSDKVKDYIKQNYADEELNISVIADKFNIHPSYLSKLFKTDTGEGILDFINTMRIEKAKELIGINEGNMEQIAERVGYSSVKTFTRAFIKLAGVTPSKYK